MTNRSICFDERQKRTVITALHFWKRLGADLMSGKEFQEIGDNSLSDKEIDELICDIRALESEVDCSHTIMPDAILADGTMVDIKTEPEAPQWLPIGEVCHGTASITDKLKAVLEFAQRHRNLTPELDKAVTSLTQFWTQDWDEISQESPLAIIDLMDALQTVCPPFTYFGENEGDSSSIGVWPSDDEIEEAMDNGFELAKVVHPRDVDSVSNGWSFILVFNPDGSYRELYECKNGVKSLVWKL